MQDIYQYIKLPKDVRTEHLNLDTACIERGGGSTYCKGLLAHLLETTIPKGHMIHVCHACNNSKCSNPEHLYWGTASENRRDRVRYENRCLIEIYADDFRKKLTERSKKLPP